MEHLTFDFLPPVAPYSHVVRSNGLLFVTGQLPEEPHTGTIHLFSIETQTLRVLDNLERVLAACASGFDKVVMSRIFLTDFRHYQVVNDLYAARFAPGRLPARTTVGVTALAGGAGVEIDLIATCAET